MIEITIVAAALATAGCDKSRSAEPESKPDPKAGPESDVDRETLAAMGYFGAAAAKAAWAVDSKGCPGPADGSELVGRKLDSWELDDWAQSKPLALADLRGRVVVVRFWTSPGCPFCEKTLPALQALAAELAGKPVTFIGAFHGKPAGIYDSIKEPAAVAEGWGVEFALARDTEWKTLRRWWLATGHRHATSVTFVIGKDGSILAVHPGPVFYPSDDPIEAEQNRDYLAVRDAILGGLELP